MAERFSYRRPEQLELGQRDRWKDPRIDQGLPLGMGPEMCVSPVRKRGGGGQASRLSLSDGADSQGGEPELFELGVSFDVRAWLKDARWLIAHEELSRPYFDRVKAHVRKVTIAAVRASRDLEGMEELERFVRYFRRGLHGEFSRAGWPSGLIAETTNRVRQLRLGRVEPKARGPALDPARLPDDRLEYLIQHHRDLRVVDALRAEREKRSALMARQGRPLREKT